MHVLVIRPNTKYYMDTEDLFTCSQSQMSQPVQVDVVKPSRPPVQRRKSKEGKGEIECFKYEADPLLA